MTPSFERPARLVFRRRQSREGEGVHAGLELIGQDFIDPALAIDPRPTRKFFGDDFDPAEMTRPSVESCIKIGDLLG